MKGKKGWETAVCRVAVCLVPHGVASLVAMKPNKGKKNLLLWRRQRMAVFFFCIYPFRTRTFRISPYAERIFDITSNAIFLSPINHRSVPLFSSFDRASKSPLSFSLNLINSSK